MRISFGMIYNIKSVGEIRVGRLNERSETIQSRNLTAILCNRRNLFLSAMGKNHGCGDKKRRDGIIENRFLVE